MACLLEQKMSVVRSPHFSLFSGIAPPSTSAAAAICARLASCRLLLAESGRCDMQQRIRLNVSTDDVNYALKDVKFEVNSLFDKCD